MEIGGDITELVRPYLRERHEVSDEVLQRLIADWNRQGSFLDFLVARRLMPRSVAGTLEAVRRGQLNLPIEAVLGLPVRSSVPAAPATVAVITPQTPQVTLQSPRPAYTAKIPVTTKPEVGQQIGDYVLQEKLGESATATVFRASHVTLHTQVAIKLFAPLADLADPEVLQRFCHQAQTLARLEHPHLVRILAAELAGPFPYLIMEYLGETTLATQLHQRGRLPAPRIAEIGLAVAAALEAARRAGLVHGDIKPANVRECGAGHIKLADFMVVPLRQSEGSVSETSGACGVSASMSWYRAPESLLQPENIDFRADMYGLGATLYHAAVGRPPLLRATPEATLQAQLHEDPVPIWQLDPGFDLHLAAAIHRLLRRDPEERFGSWADVRAALGNAPVVEFTQPVERNAHGFLLGDSAETAENDSENDGENDDENDSEEYAASAESEEAAADDVEEPPAAPLLPALPPLKPSGKSREPLFRWWASLPPSRQTTLVGTLLLLLLLVCIWFGMRT